MPAIADRIPSTRWILICALLYANLTLLFLGDRPVTRSQEARVLETSRQMLAAPDWRGWLLPQLNGEPRLRKPPLCYWYTAASYELIGEVNEFAGRLPTLLIGWACIGVTFAFGRDLLGRRGGFLAAAVLASGHFFLRYAQSAETDMPAALGVVVACWGMWRGQGSGVRLRRAQSSRGQGEEFNVERSTLDVQRSTSSLTPGPWPLTPFHFAAVGIAFAAMTKGAPAIFPVVFLGLLCIWFRSWMPLVRFAKSGAPVTALVLIVPWFAFILTDPASKQVGEELVVVTAGTNHRGIFLQYLPTILHMLLPWTPVLIAAFFAKPLRQKPIDVPGRTAVCVVLGALIPLCLTLQIQPHYLVPTLPGFALVIAWTITRALEAIESDEEGARRAALVKGIKTSLDAFGVALIVAGIALIAVVWFGHHMITWLDFTAALALAVAGVLAFVIARRSSPSRSVIRFASLMLVVMPIVGGWWAPTIKRDQGRDVAEQIARDIAARPLVGWGDADIALSFNLRRAISWTSDEQALRTILARDPATIVVTEVGDRPTTMPALALRKRGEYAKNGEKLLLYELPHD